MTEKDIINAVIRIRKIDNTIPDEVLDFMRFAATEKLKELQQHNFAPTLNACGVCGHYNCICTIKNGDNI